MAINDTQELLRHLRILEFVSEKHDGQTDKAGFDYVNYHLRPVATLVAWNLHPIAWGHDLMEDTDVTVEEMYEAGFTPSEVFYIGILTRTKEQTREAYLKNVKKYPVALTVKIADITNNLTRNYLLDNPKERERLVKKYVKSLNILTGVDT